MQVGAVTFVALFFGAALIGTIRLAMKQSTSAGVGLVAPPVTTGVDAGAHVAGPASFAARAAEVPATSLPARSAAPEPPVPPALATQHQKSGKTPPRPKKDIDLGY